MELAARHLGAEGAALPVVRDFARGAGTAALLRGAAGAPRRAGATRCRRASTSRRWRATGWRRSRRARAHRDRVPAAAAPALLAGWQAERVLRAGGGGPGGARRGRLEVRIAGRGRRSLWRALSGRW